MASGGAALDDLPADVQVCWTHDYTMTPYGTTWGSDGATIGGGYCWVHIHLPGSYPIANITSLTVTADACGSHDGQNVPIGAPDTGPCPPGCLQNPYTNHWNVLWPLSDKHNGDHKIAVSGTCSSFPPFGTSYTFSGDATFTISNLLVAPMQPVNPEPILWHAEPGETVQLSATASAAYKALQPVKLTIYTSDQSLVKTFEWSAAVGPGVAELGPVNWDGSQNPPLEGTAPAGIYLFRWEVGGAGPTMDFDQEKSGALTISGSGEAVLESDDGLSATFSVTYALSSTASRSASEGRIEVYDPELALCATRTVSGEELAAGTHTVFVTMNSPSCAGTYTFLVEARDNHADMDRGHRMRWALQHNQRRTVPATIGWAHNDVSSHASRFCDGLKPAGYQRLPGYAHWYYNPEIANIRGPLEWKGRPSLSPLRAAIVSGHGTADGSVVSVGPSRRITTTSGAAANPAAVSGCSCLDLDTLFASAPPAGQLSHIRLIMLVACSAFEGTRPPGQNTPKGVAQAFIERGVRSMVVLGYRSQNRKVADCFLTGVPKSSGGDTPGVVGYLRAGLSVGAATARANDDLTFRFGGAPWMPGAWGSQDYTGARVLGDGSVRLVPLEG